MYYLRETVFLSSTTFWVFTGAVVSPVAQMANTILEALISKKNVENSGRCLHVSEGILCRVCRLPAKYSYA